MTDQLFVANGTKQVHEFNYRVIATLGATSGGAVRRKIPPGGQIALPADLDAKQRDYIIRHQRRYGMIAADEIDRTPGSIPLIFSIGKKIPADVIARTIRHNDRVLVTRGKQNRRALAVAINDTVKKTTADMGLDEAGTLLATTSTVQEDRPQGERPDEPQMAEGVRVAEQEIDPNEGMEEIGTGDQAVQKSRERNPNRRSRS